MARIPRKHKDSSFGIQYMWEHHKEIARRLLLGERQCDICKSINVSPAWLSTVCASPAFVKYLDSLRARTEAGIIDVRKEITAGALEGIKVLRNLLTAASDQIKFKAAVDLLDRDGYAPVKKVEVKEDVNVHLTGDRIRELVQRRQEMLSQSKMIQLN
jgi:hypothetical protein